MGNQVFSPGGRATHANSVQGRRPAFHCVKVERLKAHHSKRGTTQAWDVGRVGDGGVEEKRDRELELCLGQPITGWGVLL